MTNDPALTPPPFAAGASTDEISRPGQSIPNLIASPSLAGTYGRRAISSGRSPACFRRGLLAEVLWYGPTRWARAGGGFRTRFLLLAGPGVRPGFSALQFKNKDLWRVTF